MAEAHLCSVLRPEPPLPTRTDRQTLRGPPGHKQSINTSSRFHLVLFGVRFFSTRWSLLNQEPCLTHGVMAVPANGGAQEVGRDDWWAPEHRVSAPASACP